MKTENIVAKVGIVYSCRVWDSAHLRWRNYVARPAPARDPLAKRGEPTSPRVCGFVWPEGAEVMLRCTVTYYFSANR